MRDDTKPEKRAPKVRTSHHRNKEKAVRLQELVDKRLKRNNVIEDDDALSDAMIGPNEQTGCLMKVLRVEVVTQACVNDEAYIHVVYVDTEPYEIFKGVETLYAKEGVRVIRIEVTSEEEADDVA